MGERFSLPTLYRIREFKKNRETSNKVMQPTGNDTGG